MILKKLVVGPIGANCFIIGEDGQGAVIDPGGDASEIISAVKETGLRLKYVIATHGHFDHTAAVGPLVSEFGCEFLMHEGDVFFARDSVKSAGKWGFKIDQVPDPDTLISDGDVIEVGALKIEVLHTPGHSPGGISLYVESEGLLFSGDTLFQRSIGRTDFRGGSMDILRSSIIERIYSLPDETRVMTGHGPSTTVDEEKNGNMFVRIGP